METITFSEEDKTQLEECFDRILEVHGLIEDKKIAKRILTRTHMISIMPVVLESLDNGLSAKQFEEWFVTFFAGRKKQRSAVCTTATQELDQRGKNLFRNVSRKSGNIIMSILEGKWRDYGER